MAWMWARIHARTTRSGHPSKAGFQAFADSVCRKTQGSRGRDQNSQRPVTHIQWNADSGAFELSTVDGMETADQVLVTLSPGVAAKMCPVASQRLSRRAAALEVDGRGGA